MTVAAKTGTADDIRQRYWLVSGMHKLDALTRILEAEAFDGMIIFARTKTGHRKSWPASCRHAASRLPPSMATSSKRSASARSSS